MLRLFQVSFGRFLIGMSLLKSWSRRATGLSNGQRIRVRTKHAQRHHIMATFVASSRQAGFAMVLDPAPICSSSINCAGSFRTLAASEIHLTEEQISFTSHSLVE